jgi:hypothetical protein
LSKKDNNTQIRNQIPRKMIVGLSNLVARVRKNAYVDSLRRLNESKTTKFENPPIKKKRGITWSTQVVAHMPGISPTALTTLIPLSSQRITPLIQCPITTTQILNARKKSTYRSRDAGVFAARSAIFECENKEKNFIISKRMCRV